MEDGKAWGRYDKADMLKDNMKLKAKVNTICMKQKKYDWMYKMN